MVVDARSLPPDVSLESDICIVGGGVAGITLAREFLGSAVRVCVLEGGGRDPDPETQSLYNGESVGYPYYPLDTARARHLGGSSARWHVPLGADRLGARMRPLDPIDFAERDWVPYSGWPFGKQDLDPYYERADAVCQLGPPTYDIRHWKNGDGRPPLPLAGTGVSTIIYKFCRRELFAREYPDQLLEAPNVTVCLHANVLDIHTNEAGDHVDHLRVGTLNGKRFHVRAKVFVLAAGGIEVPRLLLLSNATHAAGLGNGYDLVGRFFMEHLHFWSGMVVIEDRQILERTALYNDVQTVKGVAVVGKLALSEEVIRREKLLNQNVQLFPRLRPDPFKYPKLSTKSLSSLKALVRGGDPSRRGEHLQDFVAGLNDLARLGFRKVRTAATGLPTKPVFVFANMSEQVPNPQSRVTLGRDVDSFGQRRVQLDWKITAQDIRSVARTQEIMAAVLERIGLGRFYRQLVDSVPPATTHGGYHHMGTTRMHADPKRGVVNADCRMHGIDNLYIAGPSVFPTGGYANPVLTVVALTLRLADHLKSRAA